MHGRSLGRGNRNLREVLGIMLLDLDFFLAGLNHRRRRKESSIDKFSHVAFTHQPHQIALQADELGALLDRQRRLNRGRRPFSGGGRWHRRGIGRLDRHRNTEKLRRQLARANHRMTLDERDERTNAVGKGLAGHPELALDRANVGNALRAFLKDREMLTAQATAQRIGGVERELPLALERAFDGTTDFSRRHRLGNFTVETSGLSRAHDFVAGLGEQEGACIFQRIEARHGRCGFGNQSRRRIC